MAFLFFVCVVLLTVVIILSIKILLLRKSVNEITEEFDEKLKNDTNALITVSSDNKTVRKLANEINVQLKALQKQKHKFVQGDSELKTAVANISHDLRTPLTAINGYLDLLRNEEKSENAERYLEIIENRTEVLKQLTEELFRYSVITSPENEIKKEPTDIKSVLEESIVGFYAALKERKISPEIYLPEEKVMATADKAALSRVFSNLLNNAIKYSNGDLKISLTENGKIIFENTASTLTEVQVSRLFDRFYTVENARKSTGLGLSISRVLVEQMGGTISAELKDKILCICVTLPK